MCQNHNAIGPSVVWWTVDFGEGTVEVHPPLDASKTIRRRLEKLLRGEPTELSRPLNVNDKNNSNKNKKKEEQ